MVRSFGGVFFSPVLRVTFSPVLLFAFGRELLLGFPGWTVTAMPGHSPSNKGFWIFSGIIAEWAMVTYGP